MHTSATQPVSIVVPTFHEAANILALVERINAALSGIAIAEWELLLVDDNSDDGSEAIVEELARRLPVRMEVRRGTWPDLSRAVLDGMRLARFDRIVVMDADLSHPPERIGDLMDLLDAGCDLAVGSRYMPGSSLASGWGVWRWLNSRLATWLAYPLVQCSDPMSGFFAVDRRTLPDFSTLRPVGYKIGLELMVRGKLRVAEAPIEFANRRHGDSKMNWQQQLNYLRHLRRLYQHRFERLTRVVCFVLVGSIGFCIDMAGYVGLQWAGVEHRLARGLSFWPAVTWNWWLNRVITFSDRRRRSRVRQWAEFVLGSLSGFGVSWGSYTALTTFSDVFARHRPLAFVCGVGLASLVNFLISDRYVYRPGSTRQAPERLPHQRTQR